MSHLIRRVGIGHIFELGDALLDIHGRPKRSLFMAAWQPEPAIPEYALTMTPAERKRFDTLLEEALDNLPPKLRAMLDQVPLVVDDRPDDDLARELYEELGDDEAETLEEFIESLCGLHTGIPLTEDSVMHSGEMPPNIRLFREGVVQIAGGWKPAEGETAKEVDEALYEEIMITLLHEIGHHFGLSEMALEELGYG